MPALSPQPFTVLGWNVINIGATVRLLLERGVGFLRFDAMRQDERGVSSAPSVAFVA